jgi:hypothetical protein
VANLVSKFAKISDEKMIDGMMESIVGRKK